MAQALSDIGVPVFMADVKGDLSGLAKAASAAPRPRSGCRSGLERAGVGRLPVTFWDVFGERAIRSRHRVRHGR